MVPRRWAQGRIGAAVLVGVGCVALLAVANLSRSTDRVEMLHKQMTMQQAIDAAKKIQRSHAVTSAFYAPKPKIQIKHKKHRAETVAATTVANPAAASAPAYPAGKHVTDMTANQVADGTDVVFHDFNAQAYSTADAEDLDTMEKEETRQADQAATRKAAPAAVARSDVPRPADYARGLIVQPAHTEWEQGSAAAAPNHKPTAAARSAPESSSAQTQIPSAEAQGQIYNNDQGVEVVTGTEGDDVARL